MEKTEAIRLEIEIDRPPAAVWPWLVEGDRQKRWMKGVVGQEATGDAPPGPGATFLMRIREGRRVSEYRGTYTAFEPFTRLAVRMEGGCMPAGGAMLADYTLTDLGDRTRVEYACRAEVRGWFFRCVFRLFRWAVRRQARSFFDTLKRLVEAEQRPAAAAT